MKIGDKVRILKYGKFYKVIGHIVDIVKNNGYGVELASSLDESTLEGDVEYFKKWELEVFQ